VSFHSFFVPAGTVVAAGSPIGLDGVWKLNASADSVADKTVFFGLPGDIPITGDWNGNGRDGLGVVRFDPSTRTYKWSSRRSFPPAITASVSDRKHRQIHSPAARAAASVWVS
jgi:hypothetical protein